jgi:succinyl-CoA synthetase alpha subunit
MSIFVDGSSRVVIQGITGEHGTFHAQESMRDGTTVVAGVTPGKGGMRHLGVPVFDTVADAVLEAIDAGVRVAVTIADGIPVHDMIRVKRALVGRDQFVIGPNSPGIITPGRCRVGIMPAHIHRPGRVGVVSRSGTLNYEAVSQLVKLGLGQSTCVGIGGDPVNGVDFVSCLRAFEADPDTDAVVMIGEIGGPQELEAATWASEHMSKPVVAFVAGVSAPAGRRMGHAGAIVAGESDTATAKMDAMEALGLHVVRNPAQIGATVARVLEARPHAVRVAAS